MSPRPAAGDGPLAAGTAKHGAAHANAPRVVEHEGLQSLVAAGAVLGALPKAAIKPEDLRRFDPLAEIADAIRPLRAKTALIIGLGTGATARDLGRRGAEVAVVERDPEIIHLARQAFGYSGHVEQADGLAALGAAEHHDLVVVDAFDGCQSATRRDTSAWVDAAYHAVRHDGLVAIRDIGDPAACERSALARALEAKFRHVRLLSGGFGPVQNLYFVASNSPINLERLGENPAFPLPVHGFDRKAADRHRAMLVGYLVRDEHGALYIDLPHWEMLARRFALEGDLASLDATLQKGTSFPTAGDLRTDGPLAPTMHGVVGGGGVKLSSVRMSPVMVALDVKFADKTMAQAFDGPGDRPVPHGPGSLRELMERARSIARGASGKVQVEKIRAVVTRKEFDALQTAKLEPALRALELGISHRDHGAVVSALDGALGAMRDAFHPEVAVRTSLYDEWRALAELARANPPASSDGAPDLRAFAVALDTLASEFREQYGPQLFGEPPGEPLSLRARGLIAQGALDVYIAWLRSPASSEDHDRIDEVAVRAKEILEELVEFGVLGPREAKGRMATITHAQKRAGAGTKPAPKQP